jgi:UDP-glucose 4-epimerase
VATDSPVNLAFGSRVTLLELIQILEKLLGRELPVSFLPQRAGDVTVSQADSSLLNSLFPDLKPTPLEVALQATVEWFQSARPWE